MKPPKLKPINRKAQESINGCGFLTVWEGAVRSGKTVPSLWAFLLYVMQSPDNVFLMSGFSLGSLSRNCIDGEFGIIALSCGVAVRKKDVTGWYLDLFGKRIYLTGAGTKAAYKTVTGITAGGWYADEINLHHKTAVVEFFNRTIASTDRRHFWTLNPEIPAHWIYKDYIDKYLEEKVPGYRWFHFTLDDNPAITEERKQEITRQYSGVFYQRYILGLRVRAEGGCYPSFDPACIVDKIPGKVTMSIIGSDIGGNKSATAYANIVFFLFEGNEKDQRNGKLCIGLADELHDESNKDTETIIKNYGRFVKKQKEVYTVHRGYSDSAEQLILKSFKALGVVDVRNSLKKPILDRIRFLDALMAQGRFFILKHCVHTVEAINSAVWDDSKTGEVRLDDGTTNIDSLDALEYGFESRMKDFNIWEYSR